MAADRIARVVLQAVVTQYRDAMKGAAKDTEALGKQTKVTAAQTQQSMQTLGRGMMVGGAAVVAGFGVAVMASARFEKQMSGVKAVSNATAGEMKQLADAALKAGADTVFSASEAAKAEAELAKAGIAVKDILGGALRGSLSLAAAGQLDLADAATISAQAMNIFKLEGKDVGHIADVLAAGANKSAADVKQLGDALRQGGLVAAQTGLTLEDTTGALAAFADNALIGSDAGTSLKTMLQRLTPQSAEAANLMDELGLNAYDAAGQFIGLEAFAGKLKTGLGGLTAEQRSSALATIFGSDAVRAAAILYDQGADGIADYTKAVNDQGAAARMAATQMDNLSGDVEALKGSLETALIQSGSGANKVLREMVQAATGAVNAFGRLPAPVQQGATGLLALAGAATFMGGAVIYGTGKVSKFKTSLDNLGVAPATTARAVGALSKAMKGLGIAGAVVGGLIALDAVIENLTKHAKMGQLGEDLVDFATKGKVAGELARLSGDGFSSLDSDIRKAKQSLMTAPLMKSGWWGSSQGEIRQARQDLKDLDAALAGLVASGGADAAAAAYKQMAFETSAAGISAEDLAAAFPGYNDALATARGEAKLAAGATGSLTKVLDEQSAAANNAAKELRDYASATKALFDPIFAVEDALAKQTEAQKAVTDAQRKHGRGSEEYAEAQREALRATVDVEGAVLALDAGLKDKSVTLDQVNGRLDSYVRAGLISAAQAKAFKRELGLVAKETRELSDDLGVLNTQRPKPTVNAKGITQAQAQADRLLRRLGELDGLKVTASVQVIASGNGLTISGGSLATIKRAAGGYVSGPGSGTSDSIPARLSNGEYVINAAATSQHRALLDLINGGGRMTSAAGMGSSVDQSRTFAPNVTVQAAPGEPAGSSVPRALREAAFLAGVDV